MFKGERIRDQSNFSDAKSLESSLERSQDRVPMKKRQLLGIGSPFAKKATALTRSVVE